MKSATIKILFLILGLGLLSGCQVNQMKLVNYANPENPENLTQNFNSVYFTETGTGGYEILLQSSEPIAREGNKVLRQMVFITTLWNPIPGKTYADESQINANVIYMVEIFERQGAAVTTEGSGTILCYKGAGFVSYQIDRTGQTMTGTIEKAFLEPIQKRGTRQLGRFELSGDFKAYKNRGAVGEFKITAGTNCR
jgi:hypothetical protein